MATHYISPQSVSYPNPTQYIQNTINNGSAGDTYVLQAGIHRMQEVVPRAGDTIEFANGASLNGAEDISGGWTDEGSGRWSKSISTPSLTSVQGLTARCSSGYECGRLMWPIVDGIPHAYRTSNDLTGGARRAWWSGSRLWINSDPSNGVEIARADRAIKGYVSNVTVTTTDMTYKGIIENYASDAQAPRGAVQVGRVEGDYNNIPSTSGIRIENMIIRNCAGAGLSLAPGLYRHNWIYNNGQINHVSNNANNITFEYNQTGPGGAIGGWNSGWEAGNTKWARSNNCIERYNFYVSDNQVNSRYNGTLWWDIENGLSGRDYIQYNMVWDQSPDNDPSDSRGIFWEINYQVTIEGNIIIRTGRNSENDGWARGIMLSSSTGTSSQHTIVRNNWLYDCGGGIGGVTNNDSQGQPRGNLRYTDVYDNLTHLGDHYGFTEKSGYSKWSSGSLMSNNTWERNVYHVPSTSATHWRDESTDNGPGTVNWSGWNSSGRDDVGGLVITATDPANDPDPTNGGCL